MHLILLLKRAETLNPNYFRKSIAVQNLSKRLRTCVAVGYIDGAFEGAAEQDTDDAFLGVASDSVVVIDDAQENQRMDYHLLDRSSRNLLRLDYVHCRIPIPQDQFRAQPIYACFWLSLCTSQSCLLLSSLVNQTRDLYTWALLYRESLGRSIGSQNGPFFLLFAFGKC